MRAVVRQGVDTFMADRQANRQTADAMADLRRGWDSWIAFALERPNLYRLMVESTRFDSCASQGAFVIMRAIVERLAPEGRLTTDIDTATRAIWAASNGVLTLFMQGVPVAEIKPSSELFFDALMAKLVQPNYLAGGRSGRSGRTHEGGSVAISVLVEWLVCRGGQLARSGR